MFIYGFGLGCLGVLASPPPSLPVQTLVVLAILYPPNESMGKGVSIEKQKSTSM